MKKTKKAKKWNRESLRLTNELILVCDKYADKKLPTSKIIESLADVARDKPWEVRIKFQSLI